jgi:UDP-N-acetylmuramoyl-tripeptide--D-alanyl-D-alanine ligase
MGLSRAINEHLTDGTEVFVAEMGTYGIGEIAEICRHFPPDLACITSIGDVHLERMKSRQKIALAKSEILESAGTVILCIDYPELKSLAHAQLAVGKRVITVSSDVNSDSEVKAIRREDVLQVSYAGRRLAELPPDSGHATNVGCATAIALALGIAEAEVSRRLKELRTIPHRAQTVHDANGPLLIDDTYNSNPAGASAALARAWNAASKADGQVWVVTPGMIELGKQQATENASFARSVVESGATLLIVGHINRRALYEGVMAASPSDPRSAPRERAITAPSRKRAAEIARSSASAADVILFENDLPDHYP